MPSVEMNDQEWGQLMFILANAEGKGITWTMVNPLMMKVGDQLRVQASAKRYGIDQQPPKSDGKEVQHE
jgi:hypothetical protein